MSRSGYSDGCDYINLYRGTVERIIKGKKGQAFLRELASALDAMPEKILILGELVNKEGQCCTLGVVCKARGTNLDHVEYDDPESVGNALGIRHQLAAEIAFFNDEWDSPKEEPAHRWERMREWVEQLKHNGAEAPATQKSE